MREYRGINTYDAKKVVRPTMVPDRDEAVATGGHFAKMLDSGFNDPPPPPPDPLSASKPTLTGDPCVGYTLTCSEPVPAGGVPPYTFNYFWVDVTRDERMAPTTVVTTYDLGKQMKCLVTVSDSAGETVQVETDPTIAVFRPTLGDYSVLVNDQPYDGVSVGVQPNGIVTLAAVVEDPVLFPAKDVTFGWEIRQGGGRFNGDPSLPFVAYIAPGTAPAAALVTCDITSRDADDSQALSVEILVSGSKKKSRSKRRTA